MEDLFQEAIRDVGNNILLISLLLMVFTFVLEDLATSTAALLASQNIVPYEIALGAVMIGIIIGDLALYGLGYASHYWDWARNFLENRGVKRAHDFVERRLIVIIFVTRFLPGMRMPIYAAMGFLNVSFRVFALTVIFAVGLWTTALFFALFHMGQAVLDMVGMWRWVGIGAILSAGIFLPMIISFVIQKIQKKGVEREDKPLRLD